MKDAIVGLLIATMLFFAGHACAQEESVIGLAAKAEVDIQLQKDYDVEVFDVNAEVASQSYLVAVDVDLGKNLTLTPKIGIFDSEIEVADVLELENEVGLALGVDAEYKLVEIYEGILLSLIGGYDYRHTEIDTIKREYITLVNSERIAEQQMQDFLEKHGFILSPFYLNLSPKTITMKPQMELKSINRKVDFILLKEPNLNR